MADHGLIRAIAEVLDDESPLDVKTITKRVDERYGIPFVNKRENINSLLAQEIHNENPRWQRIGTGLYARN